MALVPVGKQVKYTETWHHNKAYYRGAGWSDEERRNFKRWEADERALRWTVVAHIPDALGNPAYELTRTLEDGTILTCKSLPHQWEEA